MSIYERLLNKYGDGKKDATAFIQMCISYSVVPSYGEYKISRAINI